MLIRIVLHFGPIGIYVSLALEETLFHSLGRLPRAELIDSLWTMHDLGATTNLSSYLIVQQE